jgi:hypothetical protein
MFKNPASILITVGILVAIAITLFFIDNQEKEVPSTIKAVPEDAVIVIETSNYYSLIRNFNTNNQFRQEFSQLEQLQGFFGESDYIDSLISKHSDFKDLLENNRIMISGHMSGNNGVEYLYVVPVQDKNAVDYINKTVVSVFEKDATVRQRLYEGYTIYDVVFFREEIKMKSFSYAFANGLFIFSVSEILVQESLRRLKNDFSLANNTAFKNLMVSAGKNVDANFYVNYKYLPDILKNALKPGNGAFYEFISDFAGWTELDVKIKSNSFLMSGFTFSNDSANNYLNVFKSQSSLQNDFIEMLPGNTASFIAFNLSDGMAWKEAYFNFIKKTNDFKNVEEILDKINKRYNSFGKGKSDLFYKNIHGSVAMVWTNKIAEDNKQDAFIVMQIRDVDELNLELQTMFKIDTIKAPVIIDKTQNIQAYNFAYPKLFSSLFGKLFGFVNAEWYIKHDGYFIFGENIQSLQNYIRNIKPGQKLVDDKDFDVFSKSISSESNLFIYSDIPKSKTQISSELNDKYLGIYTKNLEKFNKIEAVALQFSSDNNLLSTNLYLSFNPRVQKSGKNSWEAQLDAGISLKPKIVKSHVSENNEIILQDNANNVVLINAEGQILWKKNISGKILGEIHQIDLYKNNKYQFLFNTKEHIYLIDRNGKNVDAFPIKLKSPATNGMAVFDYDKDRTYRILLACENKGVFLLNTAGGRVDGWEFGQTESEVTLPAQHFVSNGKDYIVFGDKTNTYILNRKGETRVLAKSKFNRNPNSTYYFEKGATESESRFVTTGVNGDVYFIFVDGSVKKMSIKEFSPTHQFMYVDIDGNGKQQFIFADKNKLYVYNRDKSVKFEQKFDGEIANTLNTYQVSKNVKYIGVSPLGSDKIYLVNNKGENVKGSPLPGNSQFSLGKLSTTLKNGELNLIVESEDNFLLNYRVAISGSE